MLGSIIASTSDRVAALVGREAELKLAAGRARPPRGFRDALAAPGFQVIAEIKRRSPSAGVIRAGLDPSQRAREYERGGAAAISVLTEPEFFGGSLDDLQAVRRSVALPVLRKDFVLHPVQVYETRAKEADAVLLIVAILDKPTLRACLEVADEIGLDTIVEAHTTVEAEQAVDVGADLIGINNRDLSTFRTDLAVAEQVADVLRDGSGGVVTVAESGVSNRSAAARMVAAGYDAILVGEALVRSDTPARLIEVLRAAGPSRGPSP